MTFFRSHRVQVSFGTFFGTPTWDDVSAYTRMVDSQIVIDRGRPDEFSDIQPGRCSLTLDNRDGRFTVGKTSSPYYPNVKIGKKLQVTTITTQKNWLRNPDFEIDASNWTTGGSVPPTIARSGAFSWEGGYSGLITWGAGGSFPSAITIAYGLSIGTRYTWSVYARVPTGHPDVLLAVGGVGTGTNMTTKDAFTRMSYTFTATAATLQMQVWPATSPTAGQQCYIDGAMLEIGAAATTYDGTPATYSDRFTGYVSEWPVGWNNGTTQDSRVTISALDRTRKFAQAAELQSMLAQEVLLSVPFVYLPLGEATGSASAGDVSGTNGNGVAVPTQVGAGGTLTFGTATGPGTDQQSAPNFTPTNATNGKYLSCPVSVPLGGSPGNVQTLEAWFNTSAASGGMVAYLGPLSLCITATHKLQGSTGFGSATVVSPANVNDGLTHHAVLTYDGITRVLYIDGASVATSAIANSVYGITPPQALQIGYSTDNAFGALTNGLQTIVIAHVAGYSTALSSTAVTRHYNAGNNGFLGESSDARVGRILDYLGVGTTERTLEAGLTTSVAVQALSGVQPLTALQDVARTESGVFYIDGSGNAVFQSRSHRYNQPPLFSADAAQLAATVTFNIDDALLANAGNDILVSRVGGGTQRRVNTTSVANYGPYRQTLSLLTTSDNETADRGSWQVNRYGEPGPRCTNVSIDLNVTGTPDLFADTFSSGYGGLVTALGLDISARFTVVGLPANGPSSTVDLIIEGSHEEISKARDYVSFNCSNFQDDSAWVLEDVDYGLLDSTTRLVY